MSSPKSRKKPTTFVGFALAGDRMIAKGEYRKAAACYAKALKLTTTDAAQEAAVHGQVSAPAASPLHVSLSL